MPIRKVIRLGVLTACLALATMAACGSYEDPNAVIGGRKSLLARDGADPTWSPDGGTIVFTRLGHLYAIDFPGGGANPLGSLDGLMVNPDFNPVPGKRQVVFTHRPAGAEQYILVLDLETFIFAEIYRDSVDLIDPCFSHDGQWILFRKAGAAGIYRIETGPGNQPSLIANPQLWQDVSFHQASPHDSTVLYIETRQEDGLAPTNLFRIPIDGSVAPIRLTNLTGGEQGGWAFGALAESYDGLRLALSSTHGEEGPEQCLWLLPSNNPGGAIEAMMPVTERKNGGIGSVAWSPDNDRLVTEIDGDLWIIDLD